LKEVLEKAKSFIFRRQYVYQQTFNKENLLAQEVLKDLASFCRANESTFNPDARIHAVLEGRREVFLRIESHLNLSSEDLWKKYSKKD
jgi:hypothetical protein